MTGRRMVLLLLALGAGCVQRQATTTEVTPDPLQPDGMKAAANLPAQFDVATPAATPGDCPPRLRDAGLGTLLVLQRSTLRSGQDTTRVWRAYGDYSVDPRGRYGEEPGEGLRVDCARLRAIGIVSL